MIRIPSLALLALLGIVESLPAQYFLIKLDVSKIDFTNVTDVPTTVRRNGSAHLSIS